MAGDDPDSLLVAEMAQALDRADRIRRAPHQAGQNIFVEDFLRITTIAGQQEGAGFRQADQERLVPGRMAGGEHDFQAAIAKKVKAVIRGAF